MRLIAHFVGTADEPILYQAVRRALHWTRDITVVLDGTATLSDIDSLPAGVRTGRITEKLDGHAASARTAAWKAMEEMMEPQSGDYIVLLEPDEIVVEYDLIQHRLNLSNGEVFPILVHYMQSETAYRVDGEFKPETFFAIVPYRPGGQMIDRGREPSYVYSDGSLRRTTRVVANVLSYGLLADGYHSRSLGLLTQGYQTRSLELPDVTSDAMTQEWTGGGLL